MHMGSQHITEVIASEGADRILEDRVGLAVEGRGAGLEVEDFTAAAAASAAVLSKATHREAASDARVPAPDGPQKQTIHNPQTMFKYIRIYAKYIRHLLKCTISIHVIKMYFNIKSIMLY